MKKHLGVFDLTALGIAAIVGAGIFGTIGQAASAGGPAVVLLFVFTAFTCGLSALCYAQFASVMPSAGSAYSYAKQVFGPLVGWIIGWDLIMEYAIGNVVVAISWSDYFTGLLHSFHIKFPLWLSMDYFSAQKMLTNETKIAWENAPKIAGFKLIFDLPAIAITAIIGWLTYIGIKESKNVSNTLVVIKLIVIAGVIIAGFMYVDAANWTPFMPHGLGGVLKGVSAVFFAYIGFDAISTTAEECHHSQKDLPKAMIYSLLICTVLYILLALVLTGMVPYNSLAVGDPLAFVFAQKGLQQISIIIGFSAIVAYTGVLLVFQIGQPRIWLAMSRDKLLPAKFAEIHPKYHTPAFATIIAAAMVMLPIFFLNMNEVTDLTSIGTLFAFALVCAGVLFKSNDPVFENAGFKVSFWPSRIWASVLLLILGLLYFLKIIDISGLHTVFYVFLGFTILLLLIGIVKNWSFIPLIGLCSNLLMLGSLGNESWWRFVVWLLIGLGIYYFYGYKKLKND